MKLTDNDKQILLSWGYCPEDFRQIEEASKQTIFEADCKSYNRPHRITEEEAIRILTRKEFLSCMAHSAFHRSRYTYRRGRWHKMVYFSSNHCMKRYRITANSGSVLLFGNDEQYTIYCANGAHCKINGNLYKYIEEWLAEMNFGEDNFSITEI